MSEQRSVRVVVGVAQSLAGLQALRYAVAESRRRRSPLYAVRSWSFEASWQGFEDRRRREIAEESLQYVYDAFEAAMGGLRAPAGPPARLPWCRRRRSHAPAVLPH
jgi:hypothetical protein